MFWKAVEELGVICAITTEWRTDETDGWMTNSSKLLILTLCWRKAKKERQKMKKKGNNVYSIAYSYLRPIINFQKSLKSHSM